MDSVNVGIVGLGWAASGHLAAFEKNPNVRVSAVCTSKIIGSAQRTGPADRENPIRTGRILNLLTRLQIFQTKLHVLAYGR